MRGRPFLQLLLVVLVFAVLGLPVWRLTRSAAAALPPSPSPDPRTDTTTPAETVLEIAVTFAPAPEEFRLQHLGRDVLTGRGPTAEFTGTYRTALPAEGLDLALQARWPSTVAVTADTSGPKAVRVTVRSPDGRPAVERTFWAARDHGELVEIVTVPGDVTTGS